MRRISLWPVDLWLFLCTVGALTHVGLRGYDYYFVRRLNYLLAFYSWGHVPRELMPPYDVNLETEIGVVAYALWGIAFFGTIVKARDAAQRMGVDGHTWSAWAIASMILPIVGNIIPWLVVGEIRRSIVYSARHATFDDTWRTKSSFSAATFLIAISVLVNVGAMAAWSIIAAQAGSAAGVASALADMPLALVIIAACFAAPVLYLFSTRLALGSLARRYAEGIG